MTTVIVTGLLMLVGLVGIVVPVLPGLLLVWLATALWAFDHPNRWAWLVFALCGVVYAAGLVTQYLVPRRAGAAVGFVLGVFLVELGRHRDGRVAWRSTGHALKAVMMSIGIELVAGFMIVGLWLLGVWRLGIPGL